MNVDILKMTCDDFKEIQGFLSSDFDDFWDKNILRDELLNSNSYYLVAKNENMILGFGGISQVLDEVTLNNIVVKRNFRGLGIASILLDNLIKIAINNNSSFITLEVNINNKIAIHLYNKYGFKKVGLRKKYYNHKDDAILMTKILKNNTSNK